MQQSICSDDSECPQPFSNDADAGLELAFTTLAIVLVDLPSKEPDCLAVLVGAGLPLFMQQ